MGNIPWELVLAVLGVVVPIFAALYEFVFVGRKRLGYRVQMDTTALDAVSSQYAGALKQLRQDIDGVPLAAPSFVLLRIENNGATHIDNQDYAVLDDDKVGFRVRFPDREVAGLVVTELSDDFLSQSFGDDSGLNACGDTIELPKVPLNRGAHYKVLVALDRSPDGTAGSPKQFPEPEIIGGIKGGVKRGRMQETRSYSGTSRRTIAMIVFLVLVIIGQFVLFLSSDRSPLDCARGELTITGSTAFEPVLREAAKSYADTCSGAAFHFELMGSTEGLRRLNMTGKESTSNRPNTVAFSDGKKHEQYPMLLPRPIAFSLFTLVVNKEARIQDLSVEQIKDLYAGKITNWAQIGGNDLPVRLVSRYDGSGTRATFEKRVLEDLEPAVTSADCKQRKSGVLESRGVVRCERRDTSELLNVVASTPGAFGYSEAGAAAERSDLNVVRIDGHPATLGAGDRGLYPFWETEYAYTYGEPKADSLAASFVRYLTNEVGKDIVRSYDHRPCAELANPLLCQPVSSSTTDE